MNELFEAIYSTFCVKFGHQNLRSVKQVGNDHWAVLAAFVRNDYNAASNHAERRKKRPLSRSQTPQLSTTLSSSMSKSSLSQASTKGTALAERG